MEKKIIPISKPDIGKEEIRAVTKVLESGNLAQGQKVQEFEKAFARFCGTKYAVAVGNGTQALTLSMMAMDPPLTSHTPEGHHRNEVITTPFTFIATANAILAAGGVPVFVDIEPDHFCIDPTLIEKAIGPRTRAILPVHLYGQPADMTPIIELAEQHDLAIIEDACQAHGATYNGKKAGNLHGNLPSSSACFSFYPTKNMTTGEGGMVTTNDPDLADRIRHLRNHGMPPDPGRRYEYMGPGYNQRMTDICAAIGLVQLKKVEANNKKRIENAKTLTEALKGLEHIKTPTIRRTPKTTHVFHQYTIKVQGPDPHSSIETRKSIMKALEQEGIGSKIYYPTTLNKVDHLGEVSKTPTSTSISDQMVTEVLSLPVHKHVPRTAFKVISNIIKNVTEG